MPHHCERCGTELSGVLALAGTLIVHAQSPVMEEPQSMVLCNDCGTGLGEYLCPELKKSHEFQTLKAEASRRIKAEGN